IREHVNERLWSDEREGFVQDFLTKWKHVKLDSVALLGAKEDTLTEKQEGPRWKLYQREEGEKLCPTSDEWNLHLTAETKVFANKTHKDGEIACNLKITSLKNASFVGKIKVRDFDV